MSRAQSQKALGNEQDTSNEGGGPAVSRRSGNRRSESIQDMQVFMQQRQEEMEQRRLEQTKEKLDLSDQEWTIIKPRLLEVQNLKDESEGRISRMPILSSGSKGRDDDVPTGNEVYDNRRKLQQMLEDKNTSIQSIKEQLAVLRQAEARARQRLAQARQSLRSLLTLRQEAYLVTTRVLD